MDERRKRLLGPDADDADVRGEHQYPDDAVPDRSDLSRRTRTAAEADPTAEALTREPDQYVAGAEGTQMISTATPRR